MDLGRPSNKLTDHSFSGHERDGTYQQTRRWPRGSFGCCRETPWLLIMTFHLRLAALLFPFNRLPTALTFKSSSRMRLARAFLLVCPAIIRIIPLFLWHLAKAALMDLCTTGDDSEHRLRDVTPLIVPVATSPLLSMTPAGQNICCNGPQF